MGRIICQDLKNLLSNRFSIHQHGFLRNRSCTTALLHSFSTYKSVIDRDKHLDVVFFDFQKAFDKVPHDSLLRKLDIFGVPQIFINWFTSFLSRRTFSVRVGFHSDPCRYPIPSGVPQGSVSGPFLFLIFINDLFSLLPQEINFTAFADDLKIYSSSPALLQKTIDIIHTINNRLPLAEAKTYLLHLNPVSNPGHQYFIAGSPILCSNSVKDLGILFDTKLNFSSHINRIVSVALLRSKQLLKSFKSNNPLLYANLFKTYVLPILEYGSAVFSPRPNSLAAAKLEKPLRFFSAKVHQRCNLTYSSYEYRLSTLNISSIKHRRLKTQLWLLYKIISNTAHFPNIGNFIKISSSPRRPMNLLRVSKSNKDFFAQVVPIWNAVTANTPVFLPPSKFLALLDKSLSRL
uniref:Reverse transcriptase domain-containing protein n=1 Tax=Caenorhabditis japonica TaxID=281687 RepID=A0A8R1INV2_CAEJA